MNISLIVAIGKNRELGRDNKLLFQIPEDMKFFREKTKGHAVIMGRKTYESIGCPLPNRTNIVITRNVSSFLKSHPEFSSGSRNEFGMTGNKAIPSIEKAIELAKKHENPPSRKASEGQGEVFVIGGAQIYSLAMPYANKLYLTLVDSEVADADAFFPDYSKFKKIITRTKGEDNGYSYEIVTLSL